MWKCKLLFICRDISWRLGFYLNNLGIGMYINGNFYCHSLLLCLLRFLRAKKNFWKKKQLQKPLISKQSLSQNVLGTQFPSWPSLFRSKTNPQNKKTWLSPETHIGAQTVFASSSTSMATYSVLPSVLWVLDQGWKAL